MQQSRARLAVLGNVKRPELGKGIEVLGHQLCSTDQLCRGGPACPPNLCTDQSTRRAHTQVRPYDSTLKSLSLRKQPHEVLRMNRLDASELQILLDVLSTTHAHQRRGDSGRRAHKLNAGLRVRGERAERLAHRFG